MLLAWHLKLSFNLGLHKWSKLAENYVGNKGNKKPIYSLFCAWNCDGNTIAAQHLNTRGAMSGDIYYQVVGHQHVGHQHLAPLPEKLPRSNMNCGGNIENIRYTRYLG